MAGAPKSCRSRHAALPSSYLPLSSLTFRQLQMCKHFSAVHPLPVTSFTPPLPLSYPIPCCHRYFALIYANCLHGKSWKNHGEKSLIVPSAGRAKEKLLCEWHACVALATITLLSLSLSLCFSFTLLLLLAPSRLTRSNYANFNAKVNATCCMFALLN